VLGLSSLHSLTNIATEEINMSRNTAVHQDHPTPYQRLFDNPPVISGGLLKEPYIESLFF
jgi:hypothetical protein